MSNITLEMDSIDLTLLLRYLNIAKAESDKGLKTVLDNPDVFAEHPVWESNAKFDVEHSNRLFDLIQAQRDAMDEADRKKYGY